MKCSCDSYGEEVDVSLNLLRRVSAILLDRLEELEGESLGIEQDLFWNVTPQDMYNLDRKPADLAIGQLSESLDWLKGVDEDPGLAISYGLVWLGEVLAALGYQYVA